MFRPTTLHKDIRTHSHCIRHVAYFKSCHDLTSSGRASYIGRCKGCSGLNVLTLTMDYLRVTYMCLLHVMDCFHSVDERS